jgi:hypothetical protein
MTVLIPKDTHLSLPFPKKSLSRIVQTLRCHGRNTEANPSVYMGILNYITYFINKHVIRQRKSEHLSDTKNYCSPFYMSVPLNLIS